MATDAHGRRIDYLRISLTDSCNLRCVYCMPRGGRAVEGHGEVLTFEEIERFAAIAVDEGISKIRLTGGEPLVRHGVVEHIRRLRRCPASRRRDDHQRHAAPPVCRELATRASSA